MTSCISSTKSCNLRPHLRNLHEFTLKEVSQNVTRRWSGIEVGFLDPLWSTFSQLHAQMHGLHSHAECPECLAALVQICALTWRGAECHGDAIIGGRSLEGMDVFILCVCSIRSNIKVEAYDSLCCRIGCQSRYLDKILIYKPHCHDWARRKKL